MSTSGRWTNGRLGMECSGNRLIKRCTSGGVLDVPGAVDTHTAWVKIPAHTNIIYPPEHLESYEANSPWGTPSSRVEEYKCPP